MHILLIGLWTNGIVILTFGNLDLWVFITALGLRVVDMNVDMDVSVGHAFPIEERIIAIKKKVGACYFHQSRRDSLA